MMISAGFAADAWVSTCGALGALIILGNLKHIVQMNVVGPQFRFCLWILIVLLLTRIGHWGDWGWLFSTTSHVAAALLPLSVLLLTEALLRRHSPAALKVFCAVGVVPLVLLAVLRINAIGFWHIAALLAYQLIGLTAVVWFVLTRDRDSLAPAENQIIDRMALSFAVILPFLMTDYARGDSIELPVRLGGLAVLATCWLSIGVNRTGLQKRNIVWGFVVVVLMSVALSALFSMLTPLSLRTCVQIGAAFLAGVMLLAIWQAAIALHIEDGQIVALREIANATGHGPEAALSLVGRAAGAPDCVMLDEDKLADLDLTQLKDDFQQDPVRHCVNDMNSEQVSWLFARYDATDVIALSLAPLRVVMLKTPEISRSDQSGTSLRAIQRVAAIVTAKDST